MNQINFQIRRGTINDAQELQPLAIKIFNETFAGHPLNKPEDMEAYIAEAFTLNQTRLEFSDPETIVLIAEAGDQMIGFAKLKKHSTEHCISDPDPIELQRFYIDHKFHGTGAAQILMQKCLDEAEEKNYKTIWLGVWEHNYRAQRFYEKLGFQVIGKHIFQLGADPQTDLVMKKIL